MAKSLQKESTHHAAQFGGHLGRMLRTAAVMAITGHSRTTIWRKVRDGTFPAPLVTGENSRGWPEQVIADHLASLPTVGYAPDTPDDDPGDAIDSEHDPPTDCENDPPEPDRPRNSVLLHDNHCRGDAS